MLKNKKAFTIIELLVALAIIGLLTSVIVIATQNIREKAKVAKTLQYAGSLYRSMSDTAVALWDFDDGSGITAKDSSNNGYDSKLGEGSCAPGNESCPSWSNDTPQALVGAGAGKFSLYFNGSNFVYLTKNLVDSFTKITISAWVKCMMTPTEGRAGIFARNKDSAGGIILIKPASTGIVRFGFYNAANVLKSVDSVKTITDQKWHFITGTYNGSQLKIYIDGQLDNTPVSASDNIPSVGSTITSSIGLFNPNVFTYDMFEGFIDEVHIYNSALTSFEVQKLYADGLGKHQLAEK